MFRLSLGHELAFTKHRSEWLTALSCGAVGLNDGFGVSLKEAVLVQINLVDMSHFAAMNGVYRQFFPLARPAARACVQHSLPVGQQFTVELLVDTQGGAYRHGNLQ